MPLYFRPQLLCFLYQQKRIPHRVKKEGVSSILGITLTVTKQFLTQTILIFQRTKELENLAQHCNNDMWRWRQHLRFASQRKLIVPHYWLNSFGRRCFTVAGPSTWNKLPDSLRDPALSLNIFRRQLRTDFFSKYWRDVLSALEIFWQCAV